MQLNILSGKSKMADQLNKTALLEMVMRMPESEMRSVLNLLNFKDMIEVMELLNSTNCYKTGDGWNLNLLIVTK